MENLSLFGPARLRRERRSPPSFWREASPQFGGLDGGPACGGRTQLEVIRDVMLSAAGPSSGGEASGAPESGWYTLRELAQLTGYGEASISAQLRHLRKPQFGGYVVEKRRRRGDGPRAGVWEYQVLARAG